MDEIKETPNPEEMGLNWKVDAIFKKLVEEEAKKKEKEKFKFPWGKRVSKVQMKKGWVNVIIIRNNGNMDIIKSQIEDDGTCLIDKFPRDFRVDYKLMLKGKPCYILPEWSMKPLSPVEFREQVEKEKMSMTGRRLIAARLQKDQIKPKGAGFGNWTWIILIAVVAGAAWYLWKGGKLF